MLQFIKRNLKIFLLYTKLSYRSVLQARLGLVLFIAAKLIRFGFFFFLVFLVFSGAKNIGGYNFNQAIIFYMTFNIIDSLALVLFREVYRFRPQVLSGNFDLTLIKPHHPFLKILVGGGDLLDVIMLVPYLLLTIYFGLKITVLSFLNVGSYFVLLANSILIATAFHIAVLALGILTTEVDHTIMIYRDMTIMGRFPLEIYKEPIRGFFTFIIPIGIMMSFPSYALLNLLSLKFMLLSFLVSSVLLTFSLKLWDLALKKYQSWGG